MQQRPFLRAWKKNAVTQGRPEEAYIVRSIAAFHQPFMSPVVIGQLVYLS